MTRKFQSGQEKHAKNRNCVYLLSAPPSLKHSHVVADLGKAGGDLEGIFFSLPVAELKRSFL